LLVISLPVGEHQLGDMVDRRIADFCCASVFIDLVADLAVRATASRLDPIPQNIVERHKSAVGIIGFGPAEIIDKDFRWYVVLVLPVQNASSTQ